MEATSCQPLQQGDHDLLAIVDRAASDYVRTTCDAERRGRGQFFTPVAVARFMAGLISTIPRECRILDPGAGVGILSAAVCERILSLRSPRKIHIDLYEIDTGAVRALDTVMDTCRAVLAKNGHTLTYQVRVEDFLLGRHTRVTDHPSLFDDERTSSDYDAAILNPPYFKIGGSSPHAQVMSDIIHGQPNIYSLFMAAASELLKDGGDLVAITPRSFCNGLYFREFRRWFLSRMSLNQIHVFGSRTETFREAKVLQENIVTHCRKTPRQKDTIVITQSEGRSFPARDRREVPKQLILNDSSRDAVICIPETDEDTAIVEFAQRLPAKFNETGLRISTGPVVMFRTKTFLAEELGDDVVPLLSAHNVRPFMTTWPVVKKKWPLGFRSNPRSEKHLVGIDNYVLIKRFSAKEERRRLTAGCLFAIDYDHPRIAIENHLNYIYHHDRSLTDEETIGVAAVFNSALFDRYFRCISGNTQVNATEVREMRFPALETIHAIGTRLGRRFEKDLKESERIVMEELQINESFRPYLEELAR